MGTVRDSYITQLTEAIWQSWWPVMLLLFSIQRLPLYNCHTGPEAKVQNRLRRDRNSCAPVNVSGHLTLDVLSIRPVHNRYHATLVFHTVVKEAYTEKVCSLSPMWLTSAGDKHDRFLLYMHDCLISKPLWSSPEMLGKASPSYTLTQRELAIHLTSHCFLFQSVCLFLRQRWGRPPTAAKRWDKICV